MPRRRRQPNQVAKDHFLSALFVSVAVLGGLIIARSAIGKPWWPLRPSTAESKAMRLESFSIVSFNVAGFEPSKLAPEGFDVVGAVVQEVLGPDPDIICLQEVPGQKEQVTSMFPQYNVVGMSPAHADNVVLLTRKGLAYERVDDTEYSLMEVPAVVAELSCNTTETTRKVRVASVHLAPGKEGWRRRYEQLETLVASSVSKPEIIAGDTNMRMLEDDAIRDFGLIDIWKASGADPTTNHTWDTIDHGAHFNKYYGDGTRQYTARYDRMYYVSSGGRPMEARTKRGPPLEARSFKLIANHPWANKYHFLSDHFGIAANIHLRWTSEEEK